MPPPRASLRSFLATARAALTAPASQRPYPLTLVVGNESADLDSLCSALVFAYLRTAAPPHTLHIPISNLPRDDLALRPEMAASLKYAELKPSDLLTLDDLPAGKEALVPEKTRWVLVDHNALTGTLGDIFISQVVGCIDHHAEEGKVPPKTNDEPRVVEKCGSCMSLVVDYSRPTWESQIDNEGDDNSGDVDAHLALVSLAPILIDTTNLISKEKTTDKDIKAVSFLEGLAGKDFNRDAFFKHISEVKEDISQLSFRDIFRKDYKQWTEGSANLGIACVVQNLDFLVKKGGSDDALLGEFRKWAQEKKLDVAAIMTTSHPNNEFRRELLLWAFNDGGVDAAQDFVKRHQDELGLESWDGERMLLEEKGEWRRAWRQRNVAHSRKKLAPSLRESLKSHARL